MAKVTNLDLNSSTEKSALINRTGRQSAIDQIKAHLKEVKKASQSKGTDGDFVGYVLFSNRISVDRFQEIFKFNNDFKTKVLTSAGSTDTKTSGEIIEMYVYIPQLTDFLPFPEMGTVFEFMKFMNKQDSLTLDVSAGVDIVNSIIEQGNRRSREAEALGQLPVSEGTPLAKETKNQIYLGRAQEKYKKTLDIISMYPKVYRYTENTQLPGPGSAIMLHLPADQESAMPTMGYGYFKHILSGVLKFEKDSETSEALEKIDLSTPERPNTA